MDEHQVELARQARQQAEQALAIACRVRDQAEDRLARLEQRGFTSKQRLASAQAYIDAAREQVAKSTLRLVDAARRLVELEQKQSNG